ncbi:MAG: hypothetical protein U5O39_00670 [Gammaproteobacteria bacterium]|nr:hypothetical protein [Gammaproteobacteria bacterium]
MENEIQMIASSEMKFEEIAGHRFVDVTEHAHRHQNRQGTDWRAATRPNAIAGRRRTAAPEQRKQQPKIPDVRLDELDHVGRDHRNAGDVHDRGRRITVPDGPDLVDQRLAPINERGRRSV